MLYIVGTGHHYQFGTGTRFGQDCCTEPNERAFAQMLRDLIATVGGQVLAEELNQQALEEVGKTISVMQRIAMEASAPHIFCEPDRAERVKLDIKDENGIRISAFPRRLDEALVQSLAAASWRRREQEWLHRLDAVKFKNVILVCGANHIATFVPLAQEQGFDYKVMHVNWEA